MSEELQKILDRATAGLQAIETACNEMVELLRLGQRMRAAQREYFANRNNPNLLLCKTHEREFDKRVAAFLEKIPEGFP